MKKKLTQVLKKNNINNYLKEQVNLIENDDKALNELFKKVKINAKIVEYNELGLRKDTPKEILEFATNKEFDEENDIFVPAIGVDVRKLDCYDNDMKEEEMNDEYKELEKEMNNFDDDNKNEEIEEDNLLDDNFVLLANEGELPIEFINEEDKKKMDEIKNNENMQINSLPVSNSNYTPSYKYITKEETEFIKKKFGLDEYDESKKNNKKKEKNQYISKEEFDEAINEVLKLKIKEKKEIEKIKGLTAHVEDEDEFEEYELEEGDEDMMEGLKEEDKEKEDDEI